MGFNEHELNGHNLDGETLYDIEMNQYPLLTQSEEVELGRAVQLGISMVDLLIDYPDHNELDQSAMLDLVEEGRDAAHTMINSNLRLVTKIARKFAKPGDNQFLELVQEGNEGLMRAVDIYDFERGFKFSTNATYLIRQHIIRFVKGRKDSIPIPLHQARRIDDIKKAQSDYEQKHNRLPTIEELCKETKLGRRAVVTAMQMPYIHSSLDQVVVNNNGGIKTKGENIISGKELPETEVERKSLEEMLEELFLQITPREEQILKMRFGFNGGKGMTLEEIGKKYGITRERIRQIERDALKRLKEILSDLELQEWFIT